MSEPTNNNTPPRSVRVADDLWLPAKAAAAAKGLTLTDVVIAALEQLVNETPVKAKRGSKR